MSTLSIIHVTKKSDIIANNLTCPVCHESFIPGQEIVFCPECKSPYHLKCWSFNNHQCAQLGCSGYGAVGVVATTTTESQPFRWSTIVTGGLLGLGMGILGVLVIFIFNAAPSGSSFLNLSPTPTETSASPPTRTATPLLTPTTKPAPVPAQTVTARPTPTPTPTKPRPTPTPTPLPTPSARVEANTVNLRAGPGTNYSIVETSQRDAVLLVTGRNAPGDWWQVLTPGGRLAWVSGALVEISYPEFVAQVKIPPAPPNPVSFDPSNSAVKFVLNQIHLVVHHEGTVVTCASTAGLYNLWDSVKDNQVLGPYKGDFYWISKECNKRGNVLFKRNQGVFSLIREEPWEKFCKDEEALPFNQAMKMFESGEIKWLDGPSRKLSECD